MNISLMDAISLHKCISQIEGESITDDTSCDAFDEDIVVTYHKQYFNYIVIDKVTFGKIESKTAKQLLQNYFDEVLN